MLSVFNIKSLCFLSFTAFQPVWYRRTPYFHFTLPKSLLPAEAPSYHFPVEAGAPLHAASSPVPVSPDLCSGGLPHGAAQESRSVLDLVAH